MNIVTRSPVDQKAVVERQSPDAAGLEALVGRSHNAFASWATQSTLDQRIAITSKFLDLVEAKAENLGRDLTLQMGRPASCAAVEVKTAVARGRYMVNVCRDELAGVDVEKDNYSTGDGLQRSIRKCPLGIVLVISAWNYPYLITVNSLVPAILAGNTVILKPSPQTPLSAESLQSLYEEAGLPKDVFSVVHIGEMDTLTHLATLPGIKHVCFTGSVEGGRRLQTALSEAAGRSESKHFINIGLELGGKDPAYIRSDANLDYAAEQVADGVIFNSGQSCCSIERVYVHQDVYETFLEKFAAQVKAQTVLGDPSDAKTTIGPVVSLKAAQTIRSQVDQAVRAGASHVFPEDEISLTTPGAPLGETFVKPVVLKDVNHSMAIMSKETFGPAVGVQKVASDSEALGLMNDSEFGLTASIWTTGESSPEVSDLITGIEAGTVFVNRADFPDPALAWTGWKNSGRGVTLSRFGFSQFYKLKSVHVRMAPK